MMRPICEICRQRPRAVAYHRYEKIYYRSRCTGCVRKGLKQKAQLPRWQSSGYKNAAQLLVCHVDGDMNNVTIRNLKTVCQNCVIEVAKSTMPWRPGDLEPDL